MGNERVSVAFSSECYILQLSKNIDKRPCFTNVIPFLISTFLTATKSISTSKSLLFTA